jgi:hypothetical protein
MKSFIAAFSLVSLIPGILGLTINTPVNVVQCQPVQFTWVDGTPPYFLSLLPAGQPSALAIEQFPDQNGTSFTWTKVDLPAGTAFSISLKDSLGTQAYSDAVTVHAGTDASCVNGTASVTAGSPATTAAGTTAGGAAASSAPAASSGSSTKLSSVKPSGTASGSAATASKTSGASQALSASAFGLVGIMGLLGATLF